jgi:hypothetical protein
VVLQWSNFQFLISWNLSDLGRQSPGQASRRSTRTCWNSVVKWMQPTWMLTTWFIHTVVYKAFIIILEQHVKINIRTNSDKSQLSGGPHTTIPQRQPSIWSWISPDSVLLFQISKILLGYPAVISNIQNAVNSPSYIQQMTNYTVITMYIWCRPLWHYKF